VILVLLTKALPQFTVGRDKCSARGAQHRFVVGQYPRITESKTSAAGTTELAIRVEVTADVVVEVHDLVCRHNVPYSVRATESIQLSTEGSGGAVADVMRPGSSQQAPR
jgi:hypothetical protein